MAYPVSFALLFAALVLSPVIGGGFGDLANAILQILVLGAMCVYVARPRPEGWTRVPGLLPLIVFLVLVAIAGIFSQCAYCSIRQLIFWAACISAYALTATLCRDTRAASATLWGITLVALGICIHGIRNFVFTTGGGHLLWKALTGSSSSWRIFGTFVNPGFFAGFLVIALPIAFGLYLVARRPAFALLAGMAVVLEALALMLTGTKFGIVAAVLSLVVMFPLAVLSGSLRRARFKRVILVGVVLVPLLVLFSGPVFFRLRQAESGGSQVHSTEFRLYTWQSTANMIRENPLVGIGPGSYATAYPRYAIAGPTVYAHQSYLQIAAENGVPAAIALLVGVLMLAMRTLVAVVKGPPEAQSRALVDEPVSQVITWKDLVPFSGWRMLNCAIFAALVASCARNVADSDWYVIGIALPFSVLSGVLVAQSGAFKGSAFPTRFSRGIVIFLCVVMAVLTASFGLGDYFVPDGPAPGQTAEDYLAQYTLAATASPLTPEYHREAARAAAALGDVSTATQQADAAIRLGPREAQNYYVRALVALQQEDVQAAIHYFRKALEYNPNSTQTLYQLAMAYRAQSDIGGEERTLRRLLDIETSDFELVRGVPELVDLTYVQAHLYFGDKALREKRYSWAVSEFQAAVDRLERWRRHKEFRAAQLASGRLTEDDVRDTFELLRQSYLKLARAYLGTGDRSEAVQLEAKAAKIETLSPKDMGL